MEKRKLGRTELEVSAIGLGCNNFGLRTDLAQEKRALGRDPWPVLARLREFCASRGCAMLEVAVNWLLATPGVASVIAGATKPAQVEQNVKAAGWRLSEQDIAELGRITAPGRATGGDD